MLVELNELSKSTSRSWTTGSKGAFRSKNYEVLVTDSGKVKVVILLYLHQTEDWATHCLSLIEKFDIVIANDRVNTPRARAQDKARHRFFAQ